MHNINEHRQLCLRSYSYSFLKGNVVISVEQNAMRRFIVNKNTNLRNWRSLGYFLPSQKSNWLSTQWGRRSRRHKLTCPDRSRVVDPLHKNCIWILIWNLWRWRSGYLYPCCDSYFALWRRFQWVSSTDSSLVNSASTYTLPFRGLFSPISPSDSLQISIFWCPCCWVTLLCFCFAHIVEFLLSFWDLVI